MQKELKPKIGNILVFKDEISMSSPPQNKMDEVDQRYDLAKIFDRDLIHQTIFPMLKSVLVGVYVCVWGGM